MIINVPETWRESSNRLTFPRNTILVPSLLGESENPKNTHLIYSLKSNCASLLRDKWIRRDVESRRGLSCTNYRVPSFFSHIQPTLNTQSGATWNLEKRELMFFSSQGSFHAFNTNFGPADSAEHAPVGQFRGEKTRIFFELAAPRCGRVFYRSKKRSFPQRVRKKTLSRVKTSRWNFYLSDKRKRLFQLSPNLNPRNEEPDDRKREADEHGRSSDSGWSTRN